MFGAQFWIVVYRDARIFLDDNFDDGAMQRVRAVDRRRTAFHIVNEAVFVGDDECAFELPHVFGIDPEIGLQRNFTFYAFRHIDEASAGPDRAVQRRKLVIRRSERRCRNTP